MVGSAQRRYNHALLQHGSILIGTKHLELVNYLKNRTPRQKRKLTEYLQAHTISLNELTDKKLNYRIVADALIKGFEEQLNIRFKIEALSENEKKKSKELFDKYYSI